MEMNKMNALVFFCAVFGSMTSQTAMANAAKVTITCNAPRVTEGQPATVTCDFKRNVSALSSATVTVEHYPVESSDPAPVLECTPVGVDCKLPVPGYTFNNQINTKLVLKITRASMENRGRFACKMLSPDLAEADEVDPCDFIVDERTTIGPPPPITISPTDVTEPQDTPYALIPAIVGAIAAAIVIAAVVIIIIIFKKKRLCFSNSSDAMPSNEGAQENEGQTQKIPLMPPGSTTAQENEGQSQKIPLMPPSSNTSGAPDAKPGIPVAGGSNGNDLDSGDTASSGAPAVEPEIPVAGGSDGNDLESGDTASSVSPAVKPEIPVAGGSDGEDLVSGDTARDDTFPEDTFDASRASETVTKKDGSSEDTETQQEPGVDECMSPGVFELAKKFQQQPEHP